MTPLDVHMYVFDSLSDWEPGYAVAGINNPEFQRQPHRYRIRTFAVRRDVVTTAGGIRVFPHQTLEAVHPSASAMLILPGGKLWDQGKNIEAVELARSFLAAGVPVAAICGATAGLARGGLLDSRPHTSNAREYIEATGYRGGKHYRDASVVVDRDLITAPAMAPLDFARAIFEKLELYTPAVLSAWYDLFSTGRREHFATLVQAASEVPAAR